MSTPVPESRVRSLTRSSVPLRPLVHTGPTPVTITLHGLDHCLRYLHPRPDPVPVRHRGPHDHRVCLISTTFPSHVSPNLTQVRNVSGRGISEGSRLSYDPRYRQCTSTDIHLTEDWVSPTAWDGTRTSPPVSGRERQGRSRGRRTTGQHSRPSRRFRSLVP